VASRSPEATRRNSWTSKCINVRKMPETIIRLHTDYSITTSEESPLSECKQAMKW
jgi:hypothetical protein